MHVQQLSPMQCRDLGVVEELLAVDGYYARGVDGLGLGPGADRGGRVVRVELED